MNQPARRISLLAAALAMLLAADTAAWWWLTGRVIAQYTVWRQRQEAAGFVVTSGPVSRAGWPFRAAALLPGVSFTAASLPWSWHAAQALLVYVPWRPYTLALQLPGRQTLAAAGVDAVILDAARFEATLPLDPAQAGQAAVEAQDLTIAWRTWPIGPVRLQHASLALGSSDADLAVRGILLPTTPMPLPFGGLVDAAALHLHATAPLPAAAGLAAALTAWRQAGGQLQVTAAALRWGPLDASADATLTLSPALQPQGGGMVRMTGYAELIDALRTAGTINPNGAIVAGAMLGLLAKPTAAGPREVDLPLTLQGGILAAGSFPLLHVPEFSWR